MSKLRLITITAALTLGLLASTASADMTLTLTHVFAGTDLQGTQPWITLDFTEGPSAGTVAIRIDTSNLVEDEFLSELYLNVAAPLVVTDLMVSVTSQVGTFALPTVYQATDAYKAGGDGRYDLFLDFATKKADRFDTGDELLLLVTGPGGGPLTGLTPESFYDFSKPDGGHGPFIAAAHIQAIGENDEQSAWIAAGDGGGGVIPFPEPATLLLLGVTAPALLMKSKKVRR